MNNTSLACQTHHHGRCKHDRQQCFCVCHAETWEDARPRLTAWITQMGIHADG